MQVEKWLQKYPAAKRVYEIIPEALLASSKVGFYTAGSHIVRKHTVVENAFLVLEGRFAVGTQYLDGSTFSWLDLVPGSIISDLEILARVERYIADVTAMVDSHVLQLPKADFEAALNADTVFLREVSAIMAKASSWVSFSRGHNAVGSGMDRLVFFFLFRWRTRPERFPVRIRETRQELAQLTGVSVKTINRSIEKLVRSGWADVVKGKVQLSEEQFTALENYWNDLA